MLSTVCYNSLWCVGHHLEGGGGIKYTCEENVIIHSCNKILDFFLTVC